MIILSLILTKQSVIKMPQFFLKNFPRSVASKRQHCLACLAYVLKPTYISLPLLFIHLSYYPLIQLLHPPYIILSLLIPNYSLLLKPFYFIFLFTYNYTFIYFYYTIYILLF